MIYYLFISFIYNFFLRILAELNRRLIDFIEEESELVSRLILNILKLVLH